MCTKAAASFVVYKVAGCPDITNLALKWMLKKTFELEAACVALGIAFH